MKRTGAGKRHATNHTNGRGLLFFSLYVTGAFNFPERLQNLIQCTAVAKNMISIYNLDYIVHLFVCWENIFIGSGIQELRWG